MILEVDNQTSPPCLLWIPPDSSPAHISLSSIGLPPVQISSLSSPQASKSLKAVMLDPRLSSSQDFCLLGVVLELGPTDLHTLAKCSTIKANPINNILSLSFLRQSLLPRLASYYCWVQVILQTSAFQIAETTGVCQPVPTLQVHFRLLQQPLGDHPLR